MSKPYDPNYKQSPYWNANGKPWYPKGKPRGRSAKINMKPCPNCYDGFVYDPRINGARMCACCKGVGYYKKAA